MNANATPALASTGRAALYLRVSTGRQAENDLSIPDQRRQLQSYCSPCLRWVSGGCWMPAILRY